MLRSLSFSHNARAEATNLLIASAQSISPLPLRVQPTFAFHHVVNLQHFENVEQICVCPAA